MERLFVVFISLAYYFSKGESQALEVYSSVIFLYLPFVIKNKTLFWISRFSYFILCLYYPQALYFVPMFAYEDASSSDFLYLLLFFPLLIRENMFFIIVLSVFLAFYKISMGLEKKRIEKSLENRDMLSKQKEELERAKMEAEKRNFQETELALLEERNRISRQLHDSIGHTISRTILQAEALTYIVREDKARTMLDNMKKGLEEGMTDIRLTLHNMHDEAFALDKKLEGLVEELGDRASLKLMLKSPIKGELAYDIYYMVKEAITNFIKHSNGDRLDINLLENPGFISLFIRDNGNFCKNNKGLGLKNMEELAYRHKGSMTIDREKGFNIQIIVRR